MAKIKLTLPVGETACTGKLVSFRAPCDCGGVTAVTINDIDYTLVDGCDTSITNLSDVFVAGSIVTVTLDTEQHKAFISGSGGTPIVDQFPTQDSGHLVTSGGVYAFVEELIGDGIEKRVTTQTLTFPGFTSVTVSGTYDYNTGKYNYRYVKTNSYNHASDQRCFINGTQIGETTVEISRIPNEYDGVTTRNVKFLGGIVYVDTTVTGVGNYNTVTMSVDSVSVLATFNTWVATLATRAELSNETLDVREKIGGMYLADIFTYGIGDDDGDVISPTVKKADFANTAYSANTCSLSNVWKSVSKETFTVDGGAYDMVAIKVKVSADESIQYYATRIIPLCNGRHIIESSIPEYDSTAIKMKKIYATVQRKSSTSADVTITMKNDTGSDCTNYMLVQYKLLK